MAQAILQPKDKTPAATATLYLSFELGNKDWKLTAGDGMHSASRYSLSAGDVDAVIDRVARARKRFELTEATVVRSCYEAGRDGWWLHRRLLELGFDNIVVDSSSIEVNRRARRAKTDRLDGDKLLQMLLRHWRGEKVWSVVRCPTIEQEDARRDVRELGRLTHECTSHTNRVRGLLVLHNLRPKSVGGRLWKRWWEAHRDELGVSLRSEVERELARLELARGQIKEIERARDKQVEAKQHPVVDLLCRLRSIGQRSAWILDKELLGWRTFSNRREVGASLGLSPTPYDSGDSRVEQGISKAANARLRSTLIEVAWSWLRFQPGSEVSRWFAQRFATSGKRSRRVGIVAVARRLAIALWRYVETGEIPKGAVLKPVAVPS
jgi:transposase